MKITKTVVIMFLINAFFMSVIAMGETNSLIKLPAIFSDNMVLQQGMKIPIWGWAEPGTNIIVKLGAKKSCTLVKADKTGKWMVRLPKSKAGGPYILTIKANGMAVKTYSNVMVGEVWLCSGQSNMEMPVGTVWGKVNNYEQEIAGANYPNIRLFAVPHVVTVSPQIDVISHGWVECSPTTVESFSAAAYFFGRNLHQKLHVPIGLIRSTFGGTPVEVWTSAAGLKTHPDYKPVIEKMDVTLQEYQKKLADLEKELVDKDEGYNSKDSIWSNPDIDVTGWNTMQIPQIWDSTKLSNFDGAVWFRKDIDIPKSWVGKKLTLSLGPIDDRDITWFNGTKVGGLDVWDEQRTYTIPGSLVKAGLNVIVIRIFDIGGPGGIYGNPEQLKLEIVKEQQSVPYEVSSISLAGQWYYKVGLDLKSISTKLPELFTPSHFNGMIAPLIPYGIRGVIWYQGEGNADRAYQYRSLFPTLIQDWRRQWNQGNFPFLFVQLANFMATKPKPTDDSWAELREAQLMALSLPKTGMAVAIDIGDAVDIHPKNKQDVGNRLALAARGLFYGEKLVYSGPIYNSMQIEGDKIRIKFLYTGSGLMSKGNQELKGFAIAGPNKKFYWAKAAIDGNAVLVSSENVPNPVAVRYAWAANPICNLYNKEGLPASPFRTDSFLCITKKDK